MSKLDRNTKVTDAQIREHFRNKLAVNTFAGFDLKPGRDYKWVRTNYAHKQWAETPQELHYMNNGWDIEYDSTSLKDDKTNIPESSSSIDEQLARIKPVTKKTKNGDTFILMSIPTEKRQENETKKEKERQERIKAASNIKRTSVKGDTVHVQLSDVDFNNPSKLDD